MFTRHVCFAAAAAILGAPCAIAASAASLMTAKTHTSSEGLTIGYRIHVPAAATNAAAKLPLVLFLHGAGERGDNNTAQLVHGISPMLDFIADGHPAVLVVPQCPVGMQWVNAPWGASAHAMADKPSKPLQAVIEILAKEKAALPIDESRIYVTGISMGGYGTWDMLQRFPDQFAAGMPICGGGDTNLAARLVDVPIHVVHGDQDGAVPVFRSRSMVEAIRAAGGTKVEYVEHADIGHDVWTQTYADRKVLAWLFSQKKAD
ncbi:MAG: prolyl oligopeptidase family serine peptidase [Kiritimatiellia bacterium]|jgi:predicted peptidase